MSDFYQQVLRNLGVAEAHRPDAMRNLKIVSMGKDEVIWPSSSWPDAWIMVISGMVAATAPTTEHLMPICVYGPYAWFGEQPIINSTPTYLQYVCSTDVQLLKMPAQQFLHLMGCDLTFTQHVSALMAWRSQRQSDGLALMRLGSTPVRVVMGLTQFAEALLSRSSRPPIEGLNGCVVLPVKQDFIARMCGVSRSLFSGCVQELEANGWLRISYGTLELKSIEVWCDVARRLNERRLKAGDVTLKQLLEFFSASTVL